MKNTTILLLLLILAVGFTACRKGSEVTPEPKPTQLTLEEIKTKLRLTASRVSGLTLLIEDVPFTTGMDYMLANQELVLLIEKAQFTVLPGAPKVFVWKTVFKTKNCHVSVFDAGDGFTGLQVNEIENNIAILKASLYWK